MAESKSVEITCSACGQDALLLRQPKYEGLSKVGETLSCSACSHEYASEDEVPFKGQERVQVFTDADRSEDVRVFENDEPRLCCHCGHYVVNPFTQWCGLCRKEVNATDSCDRFKRAEKE